jgi:hypothetical protein
MFYSLRSYAVSTTCVAAALLSACGGGGGGSSSTTAAPAAGTAVTALAAIATTDTYSGTLTGALGRWGGRGGGANSGGAASGGGAGDGEFVEINSVFPQDSVSTGTITWKVLRSQYGIGGTTGTLTIMEDTTSTKGGYKVTEVNHVPSAVRATQGNFSVSATGQVTGTLPLAVGAGGAVKDVLYSGVRYIDGTSSTAANFSDYAGTYGVAGISATAGTNASPDIFTGVLKLNSDGSGRYCGDTATYSDTCTNGINVTASYEYPTTPNVVHFKSTATQVPAIAAGSANTVDMYAMVRKFGSGGLNRSISGDYVTTGDSRGNRTGSMFASLLNVTQVDVSNSSPIIGAWDYTARNIETTSSGGSYNAPVAINFVGGQLKMNVPYKDGTCTDIGRRRTFSPGPVVGAATLTSAGTYADGYSFFLDDDLAVFVVPSAELGFVRKFSSSASAAGACQPV